MGTGDDRQKDDENEPLTGFDAVGAAAELDDILGDEVERGVGAPSSESEQVVELEQQVADLGELLQQSDDQTRRAQARAANAEAEIEKAKSRLERESDRELAERTKKLLLSFLEVMDDLDRALDAARQMDHNPAVLDGVDLVRKRFLTELAKHGVEPMTAMGQPFDPNLHDAHAQVPGEKGTVVAVIKPGYTLGDQVLRPAAVAVGKGG